MHPVARGVGEGYDIGDRSVGAQVGGRWRRERGGSRGSECLGREVARVCL